MFQSRTHTCGELRLGDAGKTVTLSGWMENVREVGQNFAFVVLRDFYGTTQIVIETEEMMNVVKPLNKESTIQVTGVVRERTSKNPKIPTGEIEVVPSEIKVLGRFSARLMAQCADRLQHSAAGSAAARQERRQQLWLRLSGAAGSGRLAELGGG